MRYHSLMARVSRRPAPQVARVLLRLPGSLHKTLARAAEGQGLSFNEFCVRRLRAPGHPQETSALRALVLDHAQAAFGERLAGLLALGSWARGEAAAGSDIDVLIVIDPSLALTRDLYRAWDRTALVFEGRAIDAHFIHLPEPGGAPTAVWCEAAVDGLVWHDRDGAVERRLAEVRRAIADGRVVRGRVHGQPYWKGAA